MYVYFFVFFTPGTPGQAIHATDIGAVIHNKTKKRAFEPSSANNKVGKGRGVGLAAVYGILKNKGGVMKGYSEKGRETRLVFLPLILRSHATP